MFSLSASLIALVAGMFLLIKVRKENLGGMYKYISYFVIVFALLSFLCVFSQGVFRISCKRGSGGGHGKCMMMHRGGCSGEDRGCCHRGGHVGMGEEGMQCPHAGMKECHMKEAGEKHEHEGEEAPTPKPEDSKK